MEYRIQHMKGVTTPPKKHVTKVIYKARPPLQPVSTDPYALITILVGGIETTGRPTEFDSDVADVATGRNAAGEVIKPVVVATSCPQCGHGIVIDLRLDSPIGCEQCGLGVTKALPDLPDPFCNPLTVGKIKQSDLDSTMVAIDSITVMDQPVLKRGLIDSALDAGPEQDID